MKNKKVKQMICDVLKQDEKIKSAWFSNECPLQCVGWKKGKMQYINLHILEVGFMGINFESNLHYKKPVSLTANQLRGK